MSVRITTLAFLGLTAAVGAFSCSSEDSEPAVAGAGDWLAAACSDSPESVEQIPAGLSPYDASKRGEVIRCAPVATHTVEQLQQAATALGYQGAAFTSGAKVYRIAFRTERVAPSPGASAPEAVSGALVMVPDHPRSGGANPLVVAAHGSIGLADKCTPSRYELTNVGGDHLDGFRSLVLPLAGRGFTVIAPDYAGFGFGAAVSSGWILAEDEAHSVLDSTRAAAKLLKPGALNGKVALVGHSQGGHAVLAAQAFAASYGMQGTLVGVANYAPMWFAARAFGAAVSVLGGLTTADNAGTIAYALEYFYSHAEVLDGKGAGVSMVKPEKQEQVRTMLTTGCLSEVSDQMASLGATPADIFDQAFVDNVGMCGAIGTKCDVAPATVWAPRFKADRPSVDPQGAPIVIWQGKLDKTVTAGYAKCGFIKLQADLGEQAASKLTICGDATATHSGTDTLGLTDGITRRGADWVDQWVSARTLGTPEPAACPGEEVLAPDGAELKCSSPPPNTD